MLGLLTADIQAWMSSLHRLTSQHHKTLPYAKVEWLGRAGSNVAVRAVQHKAAGAGVIPDVNWQRTACCSPGRAPCTSGSAAQRRHEPYLGPILSPAHPPHTPPSSHAYSSQLTLRAWLAEEHEAMVHYQAESLSTCTPFESCLQQAATA